MPTKRKRIQRQSLTLTQHQKDYLLDGCVFCGDSYPFESKTQERQIWKRFRKELIQQWIEQEGGGSRPYGFWAHGHEKKLRVLGQARYPLPNNDGWDVYDVLEDDFDWLKRHNLLLPDEKPPEGYLLDKEVKYKKIQEYQKFKKGKIIQFPSKNDEETE